MNPLSEIPLCGLILAGGRSVRMGQDKAALIHPDGRTLARRCHDLLSEAGCQAIAISLRHEQEIPPGLTDLDSLKIVRDPTAQSLGPIVGMVAGMNLRPDAAWLIVACDLPRIDLPTLTHLVRSIHPDEKFIAYRSESDHLPEPLCTLYLPAALPLLTQAQAADFRCPRKILIHNSCRLLEPITPRALDNANTPTDWQTATTP